MDADAIVIGAGVAGLAAARALARRRLRVLVLEARGRVGGRVWSRSVSGSGSTGELGAEFIHGDAPYTMALLRESGISVAGIGAQSWVQDARDTLEPEDRDFTSAAAIFKAAYRLRKDESVDRFLQRFENDASTKRQAETARAFVEGFDAADPSIASARAIADEWHSGTDFTSARPIGGYGAMIAHLRDACTTAGVEIRLSTAVECIRWERRAVTVGVADARVAIVTLPIGVLRHRGDHAVRFDPVLPRSKQQALESIEMGHVVRVVLCFQTPFWERIQNGRYRDAAFFRGQGQRFAGYWTQVPQRSRLIVAWLGGPKALAIAGVSAAELVSSSIEGFGSLFGEVALARDECEGGIVHDWSRDPYARGAYSYVRVGGADARAVLAAPLDETLFFAGEATSTDGQGGTVNGALETGERAAAQAAAALDIKVP